MNDLQIHTWLSTVQILRNRADELSCGTLEREKKKEKPKGEEIQRQAQCENFKELKQSEGSKRLS